MKRWLSPYERRRRWARIERWTVALAVLYVLLWIADTPVYRASPDPNGLRAEGEGGRVYDPGAWGAFFRVMGELPLWLALSLALVLARGERGRSVRGIWLFITPALAGLVAEVLKVFFGRERPGLHGGGHEFRRFFRDNFFDAGGLGLPSSHTAVAFGGACALISMFPRSWPVVLSGATACGLGRVYAGAHFVTDVYVGALVGYGVWRLLRPWSDRD